MREEQRLFIFFSRRTFPGKLITGQSQVAKGVVEERTLLSAQGTRGIISQKFTFINSWALSAVIVASRTSNVDKNKMVAI